MDEGKKRHGQQGTPGPKVEFGAARRKSHLLTSTEGVKGLEFPSDRKGIKVEDGEDSTGERKRSTPFEETPLNQNDELEPISEFYVSFLDKEQIKLSGDWKNWRTLDDKFFARFKAAAKIYVKQLEKQGIKGEDKMGFGKAPKT